MGISNAFITTIFGAVVAITIKAIDIINEKFKKLEEKNANFEVIKTKYIDDYIHRLQDDNKELKSDTEDYFDLKEKYFKLLEENIHNAELVHKLHEIENLVSSSPTSTTI